MQTSHCAAGSRSGPAGILPKMDRLFRGSALMREKWDTRRGESTYGGMTIAKAIANCRETYSAAVSNRTVSGEQRRAEIPGTIPGLRR
jgi:primase-polymerase (primpol)-like protein